MDSVENVFETFITLEPIGSDLLSTTVCITYVDSGFFSILCSSLYTSFVA